MAGPADGVLRHLALGGEGAGHDVVPRPGGGYVLAHSEQPPDGVYVGLGVEHLALVAVHHHEVPALPGLQGARPDRGLHLVRDRHLGHLVGRQVHLVHAVPAPGLEGAAAGAVADRVRALLDEVQDGVRRGHGGVPAEAYLPAGGEPAEPVRPVGLPHGECGLGEVVLDREALHDLLVRPLVEHAHRRRVALEDLVRERVHDELPHRPTSPAIIVSFSHGK